MKKRLKEGTSTLNLLAFKVNHIISTESVLKKERKLIQPRFEEAKIFENNLESALKHLNIIYDFICGKYQFVSGDAKDEATIAIESLGALLQMGFLELKNPEILCEKLTKILEMLKREDVGKKE